MKRTFFFLFVIITLGLTFSSCTENSRAKNWGGTMKVNVQKGKKVVNATWKDSDLWYFIEDMDSTYVPREKALIEDSRFGMMNGKIIFVESK